MFDAFYKGGIDLYQSEKNVRHYRVLLLQVLQA